MNCVFCNHSGVHECFGGSANRLPSADPSAFSLSGGMVRVFPGAIDAEHYNASNYELIHANTEADVARPCPLHGLGAGCYHEASE